MSSLDIKVLTARKGYEFLLDDLRLTMFATQAVQESIKEAFYFQAHGIAAPPATFGPVNQTIPPGLVFQVGFWAGQDNSVVPIRFIHIESTRIVIDVAGPSDAAEAIFQRLLEMTESVTAPDGSPLVGKPKRILNFSELSFRRNGALENLFVPEVRHLLVESAPSDTQGQGARLLPSVQFQTWEPGIVVDGQVSIGDGRTFSLALRAGSNPDDNVIYSSAPLETDAHLRFVEALSALTA